MVRDRKTLELAPAGAQASHHVVEHLGEIGRLAAFRHRQIHVEVAGRHFGGAPGQAIQRSYDEQPERVAQTAGDRQHGGDDQQRDVAQPIQLAEYLG